MAHLQFYGDPSRREWNLYSVQYAGCSASTQFTDLADWGKECVVILGFGGRKAQHCTCCISCTALASELASGQPKTLPKATFCGEASSTVIICNPYPPQGSQSHTHINFWRAELDKWKIPPAPSGCTVVHLWKDKFVPKDQVTLQNVAWAVRNFLSPPRTPSQ